VLVNAAAAMLVAGTVESLAAGVARAAETIDAGRAHATLEALKTMSHME
jgi:anthranilate phosphoribosyltransferase